MTNDTTLLGTLFGARLLLETTDEEVIKHADEYLRVKEDTELRLMYPPEIKAKLFKRIIDSLEQAKAEVHRDEHYTEGIDAAIKLIKDYEKA